jgi:hypothetical protein
MDLSSFWALPFLSPLWPYPSATLESSRQAAQEAHRVGLAVALLLVRRWHPERGIVAVADGGYASLKLLDRCRRLRNPISPSHHPLALRCRPLGAGPASPSRSNGKASPEKGERLPNLSAIAENPSTIWKPIIVVDWYGKKRSAPLR